jgi:hypothetical protein
VFFCEILPKSSSLCLHSSNLGTFWLKIEQFWPFEEMFIFSNSGHLEWRAGLLFFSDSLMLFECFEFNTDVPITVLFF